ncbi:hypothetical protein IWW39_000642 [Coemansia spiralis]|uniref:Uncharacterized protein n=1 Tax=Coemansia spiralis TaxID=417178 RepID=A0A9W8GRR2_9FUNG|nr:hypothetical protein IWW39_000642 [Coemansia spiralis]
MAGEENIPFLALLLLRLTSTTASELVLTDRWRQLRRYLLHPRTVSVLGGLATVVPGVGFTLLEKALADDLGYHFPCFLQVLVQAMTSVILELSTGRHGFFSRGDNTSNSDSVRTARLVPLAALYAASMLLAHCARQLQSAHGTYLVAQSTLPVIVLVMMGSASATCLNVHRRRSLRQEDAEYTPSLKRFLRRSATQLIDQGRCSLGWATEKRADSIPASDSESNGYSSNRSSTAENQAAERYDVACAARWAAIPIAIGTAVAAWAPVYSLVLIPVHARIGIWSITSVEWARSLLCIAVSIASVLVKAQLLVATSRLLSGAPMSAARFLRHFAPLCMLIALVLWPVVGTPVDAIEALTPRILFSSLGVAAIGALASIACVSMLQASVSDGALGVAVLAQTRSLTCLGIGWWAYGYIHWPLQTAGFIVAVGSTVLWAVLRLCLPLHPRTPAIVVSANSYRTQRSRKLSSASAMGWDIV